MTHYDISVATESVAVPSVIAYNQSLTITWNKNQYGSGPYSLDDRRLFSAKERCVPSRLARTDLASTDFWDLRFSSEHQIQNRICQIYRKVKSVHVGYKPTRSITTHSGKDTSQSQRFRRGIVIL